mgnify:CR=1 FL=1
MVHKNFSNRLSTTIKNARANQRDVKSFYRHVRNKFCGSLIIPQLKDDNGQIIDDCVTVVDIFARNFSQVFTVDLNNTLPSLIDRSHNVHRCSVEFPDVIGAARVRPRTSAVYRLFLRFNENDLLSPFAMYPDDIKLYNGSSNSNILTQDLLEISEWSSD